MDLLARRDRSVAELQRALRLRGYPPDEISAALERLQAARALNDREYAERFAKSRMTHAGLGRQRVRQALRQRGVSRAEAEAGLEAALEQVSEAEEISRLARLYWARRERDEPRERLRKLWAFLLRRGFPGQLVRERLSTLWPRWRDALDGLDPLEDETGEG